MATKRAGNKPIEKLSANPVKNKTQSSSWVNYLNFGESYSSLILGIVVVIVTTVLLVFLVRDRNITQQRNTSKAVSSTNSELDTKVLANITLTQQPTTVKPTGTIQPTKQPTATSKPTVLPTKKVIAAVTVKPSPTITKIPTITQKPTVTIKPTTVVAYKPNPTYIPQKIGSGKQYTVGAGDTLWKIAEQQYGSGYNWVDIANANMIENPNLISAGTKLTIPSATPKLKTVASAQDVSYGPKISGTTYTVQTGDHLWGVAVRAYGDGFKWSEIAKVNNISTPNIIHSGQVLKLPRT